MNRLEKLRAKLAQLQGRMTTMLNENPDGLDDTLSAEYDQLEADFDETRADIEKEQKRVDKQQERDAFMSQNQRQPLVGGESFTPAKDGGDDAADSYRSAFLSYVRNGFVPDGHRALVTTTDSKGGFLVPEYFAEKILSGLNNETHLRKYATVIQTEGTFNLPIGGAKPVFGWIDELGTYPLADTDFDNKTLEAWKGGGIIQVSEELLADENFDLENHIYELIVEGISSLEGTGFLVGDGVKKPLGISQSITAANVTTTSATDVISVSDVENIFLSVKSGYRKKGTWIISDKFFKAIFKMKTANGDPVWTRGMREGEPDKIFSRPFEIDDQLTGAAGEPLAFFGDLKYYQIGDRGSMMIQRLNERYADEGMVGFKVHKRTDGKLTIEDSVAMLKNFA